ncbi:MAG: hypothetical protein OJF50_001981 [Nitrospira sp.]|jgi:hypothetical protein|nr:hypothetical protein [Nitrospira sp.]
MNHFHFSFAVNGVSGKITWALPVPYLLPSWRSTEVVIKKGETQCDAF